VHQLRALPGIRASVELRYTRAGWCLQIGCSTRGQGSLSNPFSGTMKEAKRAKRTWRQACASGTLFFTDSVRLTLMLEHNSGYVDMHSAGVTA
jgi:hypothetical protein